jgi:hypothetical protein
VIGGLGTLGVVGIWMWLFPPLRTVDRLREVEPPPIEETIAAKAV